MVSVRVVKHDVAWYSYCDELCSTYGDCCDDYTSVCDSSPSPRWVLRSITALYTLAGTRTSACELPFLLMLIIVFGIVLRHHLPLPAPALPVLVATVR